MIARTVAGALIGASVLLPLSIAQPWVANATEDEPSWSCVDDGNHICGPGNTEGKPAACYDEGGVIVALWPCSVIVNPDGSSDVYTPDDRPVGYWATDGWHGQ